MKLSQIALILLFAGSLLGAHWVGVAACVMLVALRLAMPQRFPTVAPFAVGLSFPILPVFGPGSLLPLTIALLVLDDNEGSADDVRLFREYLLVVGAWLFAELLLSTDFAAISIAGVSWLQHQPPPTAVSMEALVRLLVVLSLATAVRRSPRLGGQLIGGAAVGTAISCLCALVEFFSPNVLTLPNEALFWSAQGRLAGLFSDPNSLGVFSVLLLPLIWCDRSTNSIRFPGSLAGRTALIAILLVLAPLSGSRTFALGVAVMIFVALGSKRVLRIPVGYWGALVVVLVAFCAQSIPAARLADIPEPFNRLAHTIHGETIGDALFSRTVFFRVATTVWRDFPLLGVGPERFRLIFPEYASRLGISTGAWSDNPNSWYLGLLSETGLVGFFAIALAFCRYRFADDRGARLALIALLVMLAVGPHLHFDEVALLTGILIGRGLLPNGGFALGFAPTALLSIFLVPAIFFKVMTSVAGVYPWEVDSKTIFRWTSRKARVLVECSTEGVAPIAVRSGKVGQTIMVSSPLGTHRESLAPGAWQDVGLPCSLAGRRYPVELLVDPPWMPSTDPTGDRRLLGVQVRFEP